MINLPYLPKPGTSLPPLPGPPTLPRPDLPYPYDFKDHIPSEHVILSPEAQQLMGLGPADKGGNHGGKTGNPGGSTEKPVGSSRPTPTNPTNPRGIWI